MKSAYRLLFGMTLAATACVVPAGAQEATMQAGRATFSVGGGTAILTLPDIKFTKRYSNLVVSDRQKNSKDFDDEIGWNVNGSISAPTGGNRVLTLSGFWANIEDNDLSQCQQGPAAVAICRWVPLVDNPNLNQAFALPFTTYRGERDVDQWGVSVENAWRLGGDTVGVTQAAPVKYLAVGGDIRGIDQDFTLLGTTAILPGGISYTEDLDTRYYGAYVAWGGTYKPWLLKGLWDRLGLTSSFRLQGGAYYVDTDYSGTIAGFPAANNISGGLSLSRDDTAFIGSLKLETSKRIGRRAALSLRSEYEYYSWVPDMRYNDVDLNSNNTGPNNGTSIGDDDAFAARTSLRLTIQLGPDSIFQEPMK